MTNQHHEHAHDTEKQQEQAFNIKIDRKEYKVHQHELTGSQLRHLVNPLIGADRDLFEVIPGGSDRKIGNDEEVTLREGMRFFTAPTQINPGCN